MDDALASLKDIHLPPPPAWGMSTGLFCLILLCIGIGCFLGYIYWRNYPYRRLKQEALFLLDASIKDYETSGRLDLFCTQINSLLKRLCLVYYPREIIADKYGPQWITFLNDTNQTITFTPVATYLTEYLYQPKRIVSRDRRKKIEPLIIVVTQWINALRRPTCLS